MSASGPGPLTESAHGYLSEDSKRRFTLVAGLLGAAFFLAQLAVPVVLMLAMMPLMMTQDLSTVEVEGATVWVGDLWYVERTVKVDLKQPGAPPPSEFALRRAGLSDLEPIGPALRLDGVSDATAPALLAIGERLWVIGGTSVGYHERDALRLFGGVKRPPRASRLFALGGRPAVLSPGSETVLAVLAGDGAGLKWMSRPVELGLPLEAGSLRGLQGAEDADGTLFLVAELCHDDEHPCSLLFRELAGSAWKPVVAELDRRADWTALARAGRPTVVITESEGHQADVLTCVTLSAGGPHGERVDLEKSRLPMRSHPVPVGDNLLLLSQGMPGSLRAVEVEGATVVRSVRKKGSFPFATAMLPMMLVPQVLPLVLSLLLALVLTVQMRRHRVVEYEAGGSRRTFASLWQRALAQLVDAVPLAAAFAAPGAFMWRLMSDPEAMIEHGLLFPLLFVGLVGAAFGGAVLVLVAYSWFEGRSGRTPGKWLLGIRVLGTDLRPCGFGRALLRNLLTFVDGFFNFLVGVLLVALTEKWQRLGDLAARTVVVVDERPS